jgi:predicted nucleotidyltransferase
VVADEALVDLLKRAFAEERGVRVALLFGSEARGRASPGRSDVDVAILPRNPELSLREELELQHRLEGACGRRVDLVRLDRADVLLSWQIARDGIPLAAADRRDLVRFLARAALDHADLEPMMTRAGETFRRRLLERPDAP